MKKILILIIIISIALTGFSQNQPFKIGEKINYNIYYNIGFIWMNAGEVYFKVHNKTVQEADYYHYKSYGRTISSYDWFYKVRDTYESIASKETLLPHAYSRNTSEGGFAVNNRYIFSYKNKKIYSNIENSKQTQKKDTLELKNNTYDPLSMIYYARSIDFSKYKIGEKIPIRLLMSNEIFDLYIRYLGEEKIKDRNNKEYDCIKFSAMLVEGSIFSRGENMFVWVTNDEKKIPVVIEAKILVGSIKAYLN